MKKLLLLFSLAVGVSLLNSCNSEVSLNSNEDTPKVAETILEMPLQKAQTYLEKQGFSFGQKEDYADEYVYSKDEKLKEFSYDASIMLMFGAYDDTVRYVVAIHRMKTEDSAHDLFGKWLRFTETVVKSDDVSLWRGFMWAKDEATDTPWMTTETKNRESSYSAGTEVKQALAELDEQFKNGTITQEQYDERKALYIRNKKQFLEDFKNAKGKIDSASEDYFNYESTGKPKEIHMHLHMNNGGNIELNYQTHNFVVHWE